MVSGAIATVAGVVLLADALLSDDAAPPAQPRTEACPLGDAVDGGPAYAPKFTEAALEALSATLTREVERLAAEGTQVSAFGVDSARNRLVIEMPLPGESQRRVIADLLGCDGIVIVQGRPYLEIGERLQ